MKQLIIILLLSTNCFAQNELWPTSNAEWYYTFGDYMWIEGYSHYKIENDTTINGIFCQNYSREIESVFTGLPTPQYSYYYEPRVFSLALSDSVLLYYNDSLNVFDTLMDFNAQIGDSWITRIDYDYCIPSINQDTVITSVSGITTENVNGRVLKKYNVNRQLLWYPQNSVLYSEYFYQQFGADFLFAINYPCNYLDASVEQELRCFFMDTGTPNAFEYTPYVGECDYISTVGIEVLSINGNKEPVKITDLMGRETKDKPNTTLIYNYADGTTEKTYRIE